MTYPVVLLTIFHLYLMLFYYSFISLGLVNINLIEDKVYNYQESILLLIAASELNLYLQVHTMNMNELKPNVTRAKFSIGDLIHHKLFDYRGVIVDIDATFQLSDEWYEIVARSRPSKILPWYHVLVHDAVSATYVAEQNLEPDYSGEKVNHPMADQVFSTFQNGHYVINERIN